MPRKHYNKKCVKQIIKPLIKDGFICKSKKGNSHFIYYGDGPGMTYHQGDAEMHLRQFLQKSYGYKLYEGWITDKNDYHVIEHCRRHHSE